MTPATCSFCEYTWEVIAYMIITGKGYTRPDIWPKTLEQAKNTEDMMRTIWSKEIHRKRKASGTKMCLLSLSGKEAKHVYSFF